MKKIVYVILVFIIVIISFGLFSDDYITPPNYFMNSKTGDGITVEETVKKLAKKELIDGSYLKVKGWTKPGGDKLYILHLEGAGQEIQMKCIYKYQEYDGSICVIE